MPGRQFKMKAASAYRADDPKDGWARTLAWFKENGVA